MKNNKLLWREQCLNYIWKLKYSTITICISFKYFSNKKKENITFKTLWSLLVTFFFVFIITNLIFIKEEINIELICLHKKEYNLILEIISPPLS